MLTAIHHTVADLMINFVDFAYLISEQESVPLGSDMRGSTVQYSESKSLTGTHNKQVGMDTLTERSFQLSSRWRG